MDGGEYRLEEQVGFLLRRANQRHLAVFAATIPEVTTTQLAALARLDAEGPMSQIELGRLTAMDGATIKGVVDRLAGRGLVRIERSAADRRRLVVGLTDAGRALFAALKPRGFEATRATLAPLGPEERVLFLAMLRRLGEEGR
jgi:DNA-binding MarR family transcriptional regulator